MAAEMSLVNPSPGDEPYELFLSIAPQGHGQVSILGTGQEKYLRWSILPDKVHQVIMSMPDADGATIYPLTEECRFDMFQTTTKHDVTMDGLASDDFITRVRESTFGMPRGRSEIERTDQDGTMRPRVPLEDNMVVLDVTNNILANGGMIQKHYLPFSHHEWNYKTHVKGYQDKINVEDVLNVVASWSIRKRPSLDLILVHSSMLYIGGLNTNKTILVSDMVERCIQQVIAQTTDIIGSRANVTIKVAIHDTLCSTHYEYRNATGNLTRGSDGIAFKVPPDDSIVPGKRLDRGNLGGKRRYKQKTRRYKQKTKRYKQKNKRNRKSRKSN